MSAPKKLVFIFGETAFTLTPNDIDVVLIGWEADNPNKDISQMSSKEFADRVMKRLKANAKPTRTVIHN